MILAQLIAAEHLPVLVALVAIGGLLWRLERGRKVLIDTITAEVKRGLAAPSPEVRVQSPVITAQDDPHVRASLCALHRTGKLAEISAVRDRVERLERRMDGDIQRLHERIDEIPGRVVELMADARRATDK